MPRKSEECKLLEYRIEQLEEAHKAHLKDDQLVHDSLREQISGMKVEIIRVATKVAIYGTIIGAVGAAIFQSFWKQIK